MMPKQYNSSGWTDSETGLRQHWGVLLDTSKPCTGVIQNNGPACQALNDCLVEYRSIDLTYEEAFDEHKKICRAGLRDDFDYSAECGVLECVDCSFHYYPMEVIEGKCTSCDGDTRTLTKHQAEELDERQRCQDTEHQNFNDHYESSDSTHLIGDWAKDSDGKYEHVENGKAGYSAIMRSDVTQVVWSRHTMRVAAMCSPCYPGQADADSGLGEILCYALPPDFFDQDNEEGIGIVANIKATGHGHQLDGWMATGPWYRATCEHQGCIAYAAIRDVKAKEQPKDAATAFGTAFEHACPTMPEALSQSTKEGQ